MARLITAQFIHYAYFSLFLPGTKKEYIRGIYNTYTKEEYVSVYTRYLFIDVRTNISRQSAHIMHSATKCMKNFFYSWLF